MLGKSLIARNMSSRDILILWNSFKNLRTEQSWEYTHLHWSTTLTYKVSHIEIVETKRFWKFWCNLVPWDLWSFDFCHCDERLQSHISEKKALESLNTKWGLTTKFKPLSFGCKWLICGIQFEFLRNLDSQISNIHNKNL